MHDRACTTVLSRTIQKISRDSVSSNRGRHVQCIRRQHSGEVTENWKTMGTEILTVGTTVLLFGLCALFVRICDRI